MYIIRTFNAIITCFTLGSTNAHEDAISFRYMHGCAAE